MAASCGVLLGKAKIVFAVLSETNKVPSPSQAQLPGTFSVSLISVGWGSLEALRMPYKLPLESGSGERLVKKRVLGVTHTPSTSPLIVNRVFTDSRMPASVSGGISKPESTAPWSATRSVQYMRKLST